MGLSITRNGEPYSVIGIMPPKFVLPFRAELWTQLGRFGATPEGQHRGNHPRLRGLARLKSGQTLATGLADLQAISRRLAEKYPDPNTGELAGGQSLLDETVGDYRRGLWTLLGAVRLVLLIACANLAGLLMARNSARFGPPSGAQPSQVLTQVLCSTFLFLGIGTGLGLLGAFAVGRILQNLLYQTRPFEPGIRHGHRHSQHHRDCGFTPARTASQSIEPGDRAAR